MRKLISLFFCAFICLFSCNNLKAQDVDKAWNYFNNEQYELAAKEFEKAIVKAENENGKELRYAELCLFAAVSFGRSNNTKNAISYYTLCNEAYQSIPNGVNESYYGISLNNLAELYRTMGQYEKALPLYLGALENAEKALGKGHPAYGTRLNNLAVLYASMGQYEKALPLYLESLENAENTLGKDHPDYGAYLNNLAELYRTMGQYEKALPLYLETLENAEKALGKDHPSYGKRLHNLAVLYASMGQYDKALPLYLEALENVEHALGKDHPDYGAYLNNLAVLCKTMGLYEIALPLYLGTLENAEKTLGKDHPEYGKRLNNLAVLYESMGQYEKALPLYLESLENAEKALGKNHPEYGKRLNNLAGLYQSMGQYDKALPLFLEALENAENTLGKDHPDYGAYLNNLAELYRTMGQYEKALPFFIEGIEITNHNISQNFTFLSEKEKEAYLKTVDYEFESFNSFALQYKSNATDIISLVFDNTLTNKGVLLKSSTAMRAAVLSSEDTVLISKFAEWTALNKQIARLYSIEKSKRFQDPKELEEKATIIERQLIQESQEFSDYRNLQNIAWQNVQQGLEPGEAAIEFISFNFYNKEWTDSTLYCALILRHDSKYPELIQLFEERELESYITSSSTNSDAGLIAILYGEKRGVGTLTANISVSYADSLYSLIWEPFNNLLKGIETVYYSPSGLLHNISFSAVPYNDSLLLSDKYNLVYVSSTGRIANPKSENVDLTSANVALYGGLQYDITADELLAGSNLYKQTNNDDLLAYNRSYTLADSSRGGSWGYLKGTLIESENINKLLREKQVSTTLYQGFEGNEESFKSLAGNNSPEIIHLATHGFFFPDPEKEKNDDRTFISEDKMVFKESDNPLIRSGIIMSGANLAWKGEEIPEGIDDGILTAYEVSGMDMFNTQLVVLSACETGLGDIKGSEGVYGLQRSFKMAGVDYLIMSLWQVPDKETSEFMTLFYTHLLNTENIRNAFAETQRTMRQKYDPYYWAAFVLIE